MKLLIHTILLFSSLSVVQAQSVLIDSIIAIVEDDVITRNELNREIQVIRDDLKSKGRNLPRSISLNKQVLELLITKSILQQEAKRRGVTITDTQLNSTMQNLAKRNKLTLSQFRKALISNNIDYNTFRANMKKELAVNAIRTSYAQKNVEITEQEVDDFITRSGAEAETLEYKLSHILIALPDAASTDEVTMAREKSLELIEKLHRGEDFSQLASEFSAGTNALQGGELGWRKLAQTPSLFAGIITQMEPGQFSKPLRSASGFHIVRLDDTRDNEQVLVKQTHARHILIKPNELSNDSQTRQQLESIREEVIQGADFAKLAKIHSDDPGSVGLGGDLGWFDEGSMVPAFEQVVNLSEIGDISEVFRSRFGWHLLQVLGRRTQDETEENKRDKIRQQLQTQKKTEVLELWQRRLRDQAFVKIVDA